VLSSCAASSTKTTSGRTCAAPAKLDIANEQLAPEFSIM
jgi:hypothetical protein